MDLIEKLCDEVDDDENNGTTYKRLEGIPKAEIHGSYAVARSLDWLGPRLVADSDADARPGYNTRKAHEYMEEPSVLKEKIKVLADLIRKSKNCVAYTVCTNVFSRLFHSSQGAGISTGSGIGDYATKAKNSKAKVDAPKLSSPLNAQPTLVMINQIR